MTAPRSSAPPPERLDREAGLTIIEVLIASVVLVLAASATFGMFTAATKNAQRAKASQVVLDLAQEEMERLRALPYEDLALNVLPQHAVNPLSPNSRVQSTSFGLRKKPVGEYEPLVFDADRGFGSESSFTIGGSGGVSGTVHRYVVWRDDAKCGSACEDPEYKQVVVAVRPEGPGGQMAERGYVEIQSEFVKAEFAQGACQGSECGDPVTQPPVTASQFFLSDTPCAASGPTTRAEIGGDHLLHNTLGTCDNGLQNGTAPGAPDALLTSPPPDPDPDDDLNPALYDYSDDFYLEPTPDTDRGVQIRRDDTSGCNYVPTGTTNPQSQVHRWVTDPMQSQFLMKDKATLEFSTRTLNDALHTGTLCAYLFKRTESGSPGAKTAQDTLLTDKANGSSYWTYSPSGNSFWPRFAWTKTRLTMFFTGAPYTIPAGARLGVALSVERSNTPADAIPIMYDHPNHPTRLEVDTDTPIGG